MLLKSLSSVFRRPIEKENYTNDIIKEKLSCRPIYGSMVINVVGEGKKRLRLANRSTDIVFKDLRNCRYEDIRLFDRNDDVIDLRRSYCYGDTLEYHQDDRVYFFDYNFFENREMRLLDNLDKAIIEGSYRMFLDGGIEFDQMKFMFPYMLFKRKHYHVGFRYEPDEMQILYCSASRKKMQFNNVIERVTNDDVRYLFSSELSLI